MNDKEKFEDLMNRLNAIKSILETNKEKFYAIEKVIDDDNYNFHATRAKIRKILES